jgi:hypothetical protein
MAALLQSPRAVLPNKLLKLARCVSVEAIRCECSGSAPQLRRIRLGSRFTETAT